MDELSPFRGIDLEVWADGSLVACLKSALILDTYHEYLGHFQIWPAHELTVHT